MRPLPEARDLFSLVIRTDFSDDATWEALCKVIEEPVGEFRAFLDIVNDGEYEGLTAEQVPPLAPSGPEELGSLFLVDQVAISDPEHPILVLDLLEQPPATFRILPSEMWWVQGTLAVGTLLFEELAAGADEDGVHRGRTE